MARTTETRQVITNDIEKEELCMRSKPTVINTIIDVTQLSIRHDIQMQRARSPWKSVCACCLNGRKVETALSIAAVSVKWVVEAPVPSLRWAEIIIIVVIEHTICIDIIGQYHMNQFLKCCNRLFALQSQSMHVNVWIRIFAVIPFSLDA